MFPPIDEFKSLDEAYSYAENHDLNDLKCKVCGKIIEKYVILGYKSVIDFSPKYWVDRRDYGDGKWQKMFYFCCAEHSLEWYTNREINL